MMSHCQMKKYLSVFANVHKLRSNTVQFQQHKYWEDQICTWTREAPST
ncbi:unnamed protein product [Acanthoscelides obtectus]|uniref:Uncharacterized protein n=1 Tax=Acanthoscelides obtectus TaxID=200917 RepID=A0A9P0LQW8_ACAOB|nr:unnamed protein product [Acanthoscelides obtectus]CAK1627658.1 hypothetical protein AOBTE_LOCUS4739 [Acanthoscelides obtectus]